MAINGAGRGPCANDAYWSASADEDGEVTVTIECDAMPAPDCGFHVEFAMPWGATSSTVLALIKAHRDGDKNAADLMALLADLERKD